MGTPSGAGGCRHPHTLTRRRAQVCRRVQATWIGLADREGTRARQFCWQGQLRASKARSRRRGSAWRTGRERGPGSSGGRVTSARARRGAGGGRTRRLRRRQRWSGWWHTWRGRINPIPPVPSGGSKRPPSGMLRNPLPTRKGENKAIKRGAEDRRTLFLRSLHNNGGGGRVRAGLGTLTPARVQVNVAAIHTRMGTGELPLQTREGTFLIISQIHV